MVALSKVQSLKAVLKQHYRQRRIRKYSRYIRLRDASKSIAKKRELCRLGVDIGDNPYIDHDVWILYSESLTIGNNVVISAGTIIHAGGGVNVGNNVLIGYGSRILSTNHRIPLNQEEPIRWSGHEPGAITIEENCWLGANSILLAGISIEQGTVVAAGAVVSKSHPEYCLLAGVLAYVIRRR